MSHRFPPLAPQTKPRRSRSVAALMVADLPWGELALASLVALLFALT
jgi:hypothetical protein